MIQRIQTLWLLLASLTLFLLFLLPYAQYSDNLGISYVLKITGQYKHVANQNIVESTFILKTIGLVITALIPFLLIFNYKNRKRQKSLIYGSFLLVFLFTIWLFLSTKNILAEINQQLGISNLAIGSLLLPLSILFLFLALKGIINDEKLLKSADRLR